MINPLAIATRGRISNSAKKTLTLASVGLLLFITPPTPTENQADGRSHSKVLLKVNNERIRMDDDEVINLIKMFMQCQ
jgi:hypothetical protein